MGRHYLINGVKVPFTAEEETARDAEEALALKHFADNKYLRDRQYPSITEQLDQLFRDINAGKFGTDAKTGEWYKKIKEIKEENPKP